VVVVVFKLTAAAAVVVVVVVVVTSRDRVSQSNRLRCLPSNTTEVAEGVRFRWDRGDRYVSARMLKEAMQILVLFVLVLLVDDGTSSSSRVLSW